MAYGYLKRISKTNEDVKIYYDERKVFEAFIMAIRTGEDTPDKVEEEIEKEAYLKHSRITPEEYETLCNELMYYQISTGYYNEEKDKYISLRIWKDDTTYDHLIYQVWD